MSAAIRHAMTWGKDEDGSIYVIPIQQADGNWIRHADYAKLEAEVERLRKAGDAMQKSMLECGPNEMATAFHYDEWWVSYYGWNAAKEGKPSA